MKLLLLFAIFFNSPLANSLEVQCSTQFKDLTAVVKTSESSGQTYLLFLSEVGLEKYWPLSDKLWSHSESGFQYQDGETQAFIDYSTGHGSLTSQGPLIRGQSSISLTQCLLFD